MIQEPLDSEEPTAEWLQGGAVSDVQVEELRGYSFRGPPRQGVLDLLQLRLSSRELLAAVTCCIAKQPNAGNWRVQESNLFRIHHNDQTEPTVVFLNHQGGHR